MSADWTTKAIARVLRWGCRYWVAVDHEARLPMSATALDAQLSDTRLAFKHDRTTTVAKVAFEEQEYVLKRYNPRSQWHKVKRALRRSRARRCWQMSFAFADAGLNVAEPVLMYEHRFGPIRQDAYFINRMLSGEVLLSALPKMALPEQRLVREALVNAFDKMASARLTHGDLKASNLIWSDGELFFIDLDAAQKHSNSVTWKKSHQRDRKRFLKNWESDEKMTELFVDLT